MMAGSSDYVRGISQRLLSLSKSSTDYADFPTISDCRLPNANLFSIPNDWQLAISNQQLAIGNGWESA
jgi:hypothetical protein